MVEGCEDLADALVHGGEHAGVGAAGALEVGVGDEIAVGHLEGIVHGVERDVEEEGLAGFFLADPASRFVGDQVGGVALVMGRLVVAMPVEDAVAQMGEVIDVAEPEAVLVIEAAAGGAVGGVGFAEVPFADEGGFVADVAEGVRQRALGEREAPGGVGADDAVDAGVRRVAPGEERGARRRADGLRVERFQNRAVAGELVEVRRLDVGAAVEAGVGVTQVVGEDVDDVGFRRGGGRGRSSGRRGCEGEKEGKREGEERAERGHRGRRSGLRAAGRKSPAEERSEKKIPPPSLARRFATGEGSRAGVTGKGGRDRRCAPRPAAVSSRA